MWNARLDEAEAWINFAGRNNNNLIYADDTTLIAENEEELKSLLKVKEKKEKVGLKLSIKKTKIMAAGPITSWQTNVKTKEKVTDCTFGGGSKSLQVVTAAMQLKDTCSFKEKIWPN